VTRPAHHIVMGETAVIGNDCSILQGVTLGGTGKADEDRHPKIGDRVLIGAGACILGNIKISDGSKVAAGKFWDCFISIMKTRMMFPMI